MKNPKARNENLLVEEVAGELLIYDVNHHRAHCLNDTAAAIWRGCDGSRSIDNLGTDLFPKLSVTDARRLVSLGVERLRRRGLVEGPAGSASVDVSKRQLLKKAALLAAAAGVVAPLISTVIAPTTTYAFSCMPTGMPCSSPFQCCSGLCKNLLCT